MFRPNVSTSAKTINITIGVKTKLNNGIKTYQLGNQATLYNMAKQGVKMVYKNHWNETKVLPMQIQHELLLSWLHCEETIPESDEDIKGILREMEEGWESLKPITPTKFLYLMRLPQGIPPFAHEKNHVIWDYYIWTEGMRERKICEFCFAKKGQFFKPYSANMWFERRWLFAHIEDHDIYNGDEILDNLIWDSDNWCNECIYEPLWLHILDDDTCLEEYDYHLKRRRRWKIGRAHV